MVGAGKFLIQAMEIVDQSIPVAAEFCTDGGQEDMYACHGLLPYVAHFLRPHVARHARLRVTPPAHEPAALLSA